MLMSSDLCEFTTFSFMACLLREILNENLCIIYGFSNNLLFGIIFFIEFNS